MDSSNAFISQYLAALEMLKQAINACPESLWRNPADYNTFSQVAYHALYWTHTYLETPQAPFQLWSRHRDEYRLSGDEPTPASETADKETVLAYLAFCQTTVISQVPNLDWAAPSGYDWVPLNKFELQLYSIRHLQHHVGELMERLNARAGIELDWIGFIPPPTEPQP